MEANVALRLITKGVGKSSSATWADFGAGNGTFTLALAAALGSGNTIFAIDKDQQVLDTIRGKEEGQATVIKLKNDFLTDDPAVPLLDGVLMANALHFVEKKHQFVTRLKRILKPVGRIIMIEYDTTIPNPWVPFPIDYSSLAILIREAGFKEIEKLDQQPSRYGRANIYSALIR